MKYALNNCTANNMNIKPLGDRVLVEIIHQEEGIKDGIIIPDIAKDKPNTGIVVAIGPGNIDLHKKRTTFTVKLNDTVLIPKYGSTELKLNNKTFVIIKEEDILGIVSKKL